MAQQAQNMSMIFDDEPEEDKPTHIIRDRDNKFTKQFCSILECDGIEFREIAPLSPNMNPFAEAWVQRTKHEVLNHFIVLGEKRLRLLLKEWLTYYHAVRPQPVVSRCALSPVLALIAASFPTVPPVRQWQAASLLFVASSLETVISE